MTGAQMTLSSLGIVAPPGRREDATLLVQQLAAGGLRDREIPPSAANLIAQAVAIITMYPGAAGRRADIVLADGEQRLREHPLMQLERARLAESLGDTDAAAALDEVAAVGRDIFTALGARNIPHQACALLGLAAGRISEHMDGSTDAGG